MFSEHHSDAGNARWFVRLHGEGVRYVRERRAWIVNAGTHWGEDSNGELERMAKAAVTAMLADLDKLSGDARDGLYRHVLRSEQAPRIAAMLSLAQSEPGITIPQSALDADPWILGVRNGAIDLRTGKFFLPKADAYVTRQAACDYNPRAKAPTWCAFLGRVMNSDAGMIEFLQRAVGYSLTGSQREQCILICHNVGQNGKSTFLRAIRDLLDGYACDAGIDTFMNRHDGAASNDLARLAGARFVRASETDEGRRLAEGLIKLLTGGERLTARFLFREYFEYLPQFKIWLGVNHKPVIRGDDYAIWRRIRLIPFPVTITEQERDPDIDEKLRREFSGILNWALHGCLQWQREGLRPPASVTAATDNYRSEQDRVGQWIAERCVIAPGAIAQASLLYRDYAAWAEARGEHALTQTSFGRRLGERGFDKDEGRLTSYREIALRDSSDSCDSFSQTKAYTRTQGKVTGKPS